MSESISLTTDLCRSFSWIIDSAYTCRKSLYRQVNSALINRLSFLNNLNSLREAADASYSFLDTHIETNFHIEKMAPIFKIVKRRIFLEGYGQNESSYNDRKHTKLLIYINIHKHYNELITFIIISQYYTAKNWSDSSRSYNRKLYPVEQKKRHCPERLICHDWSRWKQTQQT